MNRNLFASAAASVLAALVLGTAAGADAATIGVGSITGAWSNAQGGTYVNTTGTGGSTPRINWGEPSAGVLLGIMLGPQSGYKFTASTSLSVAEDTPFILGTLTHYNEPIKNGTSITGVQLEVDASLSINGKSIGIEPFQFIFSHNETPNTSSGCCADVISVATLKSTSTFTLNGYVYTLNIAGFEVGGKITSSFSSAEGYTNTAKLIGEFSVSPFVTPVPAAAWFMASGLASLAGIRRLRRRAAKQAA